MNWRRHRVTISNHAWQRWQERVQSKAQRKKVTKLVTAKLNAALRGSGLQRGANGEWKLWINPWVCACLMLVNHGWIVRTFIVRRPEQAERVV